MTAGIKRGWAVRGVLLVLLAGSCWLLASALGFRLHRRIDDRAGLLDRRRLPWFEDYLSNIE